MNVKNEEKVPQKAKNDDIRDMQNIN